MFPWTRLSALLLPGLLGLEACATNDSEALVTTNESSGGMSPGSGGFEATASGGDSDIDEALGGGGDFAEAGGSPAGGNSSGGSSADGSGGSGSGGDSVSNNGSGGLGSGGNSSDKGSACQSEMIGWASVAGDEVPTTTGGGDAEAVRPKSAQELIDWAADSEARVIEVEGSFDVPRLQIASNKTLIGIGTDATLRGGLRVRGSASSPVSNVIIRNLHIDGATSDVDGDAFQIYFAHHVWVDHCDIYDGPDGNLDLTHASNWVTVSWTKFHYTENYQSVPDEPGDHRFSTLIGHSDNNAEEDRGRLKVSFHHNHWGDGVIERMPRVRFGQVHSFNNLFSSDATNYCIRAGMEAHILSEGNYFLNQKNSHQFNNSSDEGTAHITARNNFYDGSPDADGLMGGGTPYEDGYSAVIDEASTVPETVAECVGPR